jgi:hypothetical protein
MKITAVTLSILFCCIHASDDSNVTAPSTSSGIKRKITVTALKLPTKRKSKIDELTENTDEQIKKLKIRIGENVEAFKQSFSNEQLDSIVSKFVLI